MRRAATWATAAATCLLIAACAPTATEVSAEALWVGTKSDGSPAAGTLPFQVASTPSDFGTVQLDTQRMQDDGGGEVWVAMASVAAAVATLASGQALTGTTLTYSVDGSIDGPSAGGLMTAATYATLLGHDIEPDVSMTGTVLPDGTLGIVGGIPEKIRAAADNGITTVLIPQSQSIYANFTTGETTDVVALGDSLGVRVVPVMNVWQGYEVLTGEPVAPLGEATPPPIDPVVLDVYGVAAEELLTTLSSWQPVALPKDLSAAQARGIVSEGIARAEGQRVAGNPVGAFFYASQTLLTVEEWGAVADLESILGSSGVEKSRSQVGRDAEDLVAQAVAVVRDVSGMDWSTVEQVAGVPAALAWAFEAIRTGQAASKELSSSAGDDVSLSRWATAISSARYRLDVYTPVILEAYRAAPGNITLTPAEGGGLVKVGAFLDQGAEVNLTYVATRTGSPNDPLLKDLLTLNDNVNASGNDVTGAPHVAALGRSVYEWVTSTALVAQIDVLTPADSSSGELSSNIRVIDERQFDVEIASVRAAAELQYRTLAARDVDTSALRSQALLGQFMASSTDPSASVADRRLGLAYQWSTLVSGAAIRSAVGNPAG